MVSVDDVVVPLHSVDPEAGDADLAVMRDVVGDARVVCLGESVHWGSELTRWRDRVLRFLVRELGFSVFALESGLPEGLAVDRWIHGADDDLTVVARTGISHAFGQCTEMHDQLRWMRAHDGPLAFWGIDVPGDCADPAPGVAAALARLGARPGDEELLADAELGGLPPDPHGTGRAPSVPAGLADRIAALLARAETAGDEVAQRCVRGALAVVEFRAHGLYRGPGRNLRNEVMADNLRWLLSRDPDARVLVGAHTMHVQRSPSFDGTAPIGALLDDELGDDLRRTDPEVLAGVTAIQATHGIDVEIDPRRAFDAVVHVRGVTPVHGV